MKKIVITSTLKPYNEVRMYERFGLSLAKTNKYVINIIGIAPKKEPPLSKHISGYAIPDSSRIFWKRLRNLFRVYALWKKLKPDVIIITSPELLPMATWYKWVHRLFIIFDVQENYILNIKYQRIYGPLQRVCLLSILRLITAFTYRYIDRFLLAEKAYLAQLDLDQRRCTILENKTVPYPFERPGNGMSIRLLFSGMLSTYTGIQTALDFYESLARETTDIQLVIAGMAYDPVIISMLRKAAISDGRIKPIGIDQFVDHQEIRRQINHATVGIICHQYSPVSEARIPTKLYEYTYYNLHYLVSEDTSWANLGSVLGGAIPINFKSFEPREVLNSLKNPPISFSKQGSQSASWSGEEDKLLTSVAALLDGA